MCFKGIYLKYSTNVYEWIPFSYISRHATHHMKISWKYHYEQSSTDFHLFHARLFSCLPEFLDIE